MKQQMALIRMQDIDQFSDVSQVADSLINREILSNIRRLHEINDIEKFIREILYDPNETPHGPTEIADILSTRLVVRGTKKFTAFVLKGRSFGSVTGNDVAGQFFKLRQLPNLGLIVFVAIGNIQDDAHRNFIQTAIDIGCDYLVIDAHDLARLFIAYGKICPRDGTPFTDGGVCQHGHLSSESVMLEIPSKEEIKFTLVKQREVSMSAKRYAATILLDRHILGKLYGRSLELQLRN
jgi:hypothetical protein